jgi:hypothetical protein
MDMRLGGSEIAGLKIPFSGSGVYSFLACGICFGGLGRYEW